jgi:hypothetical protein
VPIPYFSHGNGTLPFNPGVGAGERLSDEADMLVPCANVEVEVVLPVAKPLLGCRSLRRYRNGAKTEPHGEEEKIECDAARFQVNHICSSL